MSGIAQYGAALDALYQNFNAAFDEGYSAINDQNNLPWWDKVAMRIDSTTDEEVHTWIQQIPEVREWLGDRHFAALSEASYRLKNRHFERSVAVNKNRLHDRRISVEAPLMRSLGRAFRKFPDRAIASELLIGYASRKCWDGLSFFNDTHYVDPLNTAAGSFDNLRASTALTAANFDTVYADMCGFEGPDGQPLGIVPDTLIVPPTLRTTALLIAKAAYVPSAAGTATQTNVNEGTVDVLVIPELASESTTWYLASLKGAFKPLIVQVREEPVFELILGPDSDHCRKKNELVYGADCRCAFGYGLPQLMVRCTA